MFLVLKSILIDRKKTLARFSCLFVAVFGFFFLFASNAYAVSITVFGTGFSTQVPDILLSKVAWTVFVLFAVKLLLIFLLLLAGYLFDWVVQAWIIDATSWFGLNVVENTWELIRNVADSFFIFVLLYIGIATILYGFSQYKKALITVIVTAMLVNFSWYFTLLSIDISNVLAGTFYSKIQNELLVDSSGTSRNIGWYFWTELNNSNFDFLEIQKTTQGSITGTTPTDDDIINSSSLSNEVESGLKGEDSPTLDPSASGGFGLVDKIISWVVDFLMKPFIWLAGNLLQFFANYLMYVLLIYVLLYMAFMLIGRYIMLIFLLILSPLAFASLALPQARAYIWNKWSSELIGLLILAPVLMLLLYISLAVAENAPLSGGEEFLKYIFIAAFLFATISAAKTLSSSLAGYVSKTTNYITGAAAGKTMGAAANRYRKTLGQSAYNELNSKQGNDLRVAAATGNKKAQGRLTGLNRMANSSFDLRDSDTFKKTTGVMSSLGLSGVDYGKSTGKGGAAAVNKKKLEEDEKYINNVLLKGAGGENIGAQKTGAFINDPVTGETKEETIREKYASNLAESAQNQESNLGTITSWEQRVMKEGEVINQRNLAAKIRKEKKKDKGDEILNMLNDIKSKDEG